MRSWNSALLTHLQNRLPIRPHFLMWFEAKNRTTGATETLGLWDGWDVRSFTIDAVSRTYYGAGNLLGLEALKIIQGLSVQMQQASLSHVSAEVIQLIRTYDARLAPVEIHLVVYNPENEALIGVPERVFKGFVEKITLPKTKWGEPGEVSMTMASSARGLTIARTDKRSNATLRARAPSDAFRKYADTAGKTEVFWGKNKSKPPTNQSGPGWNPRSSISGNTRGRQ